MTDPSPPSDGSYGPPQHSPRIRILLVEDEPLVLQFAASQLASFGYGVTTAASAPDALTILEQDRSFDLLFTDVVLPKGMSGVELVRRARILCPDLRIVITSGYSEDVFQLHGRPEPGTIMLPKPYRRHDLSSAIRRALLQEN